MRALLRFVFITHATSASSDRNHFSSKGRAGAGAAAAATLQQ
jgi:hypothetical protein